MATQWHQWKWAWRPSSLSLNRFLVFFPTAANLNEIVVVGEYDMGDFSILVQRWEASFGAHKRVYDTSIWLQLTFVPRHYNKVEVLGEALKPLGKLLCLSKSTEATFGTTTAIVQMLVDTRPKIPPSIDSMIGETVYRICIKPIRKTDNEAHVKEGVKEDNRNDGGDNEPMGEKNGANQLFGKSRVIADKGKAPLVMSTKKSRSYDQKEDEDEVDYSGEDMESGGWEFSQFQAVVWRQTGRRRV